MPKIQWEHRLWDKWAYWRDHAKAGLILLDDPFARAEWRAEDPDVPESDWHRICEL